MVKKINDMMEKSTRGLECINIKKNQIEFLKLKVTKMKLGTQQVSLITGELRVSQG